MLDTGKKTGATKICKTRFLPSKYTIWWERKTNRQLRDIAVGVETGCLRSPESLEERGRPLSLSYTGVKSDKGTLNCVKISSKKDVN